MIESPKGLLTALKQTFAARPAPEPLRVLVVDDEAPIRNYVNRVLQKAGYQTTVAEDALEAVRLTWSHGPFDVLVTDLVMPHLSGDELARRLRTIQPDLPVLYVTGFSDRLFADRQLLWESEAFLDKPFSPTGLLEALAQVTLTTNAAAAAH